MPITINTIPEHNLVIFSHTGEIPDNEFIEFYGRHFQGDTFDSNKKLLIDLREADSRPRNPDTLRQFAEFVKEHINDPAKPPKVAIVAPKSLTFGLARMYQAYTDTVPWEFVVFRAIDAALAWLNVPEDIIDYGGKE